MLQKLSKTILLLKGAVSILRQLQIIIKSRQGPLREEITLPFGLLD
jgi:hypothetical protein